jgi:hypothetical protein
VTYHHGWLFIQEENGNTVELFNHARTAAYLQSSSALGCGTVYGVLDDGGCTGYRWAPPDDVDTSENWAEQSYSTPAADGAPWYNSDFSESADALGFWVTEWTGLDSGHVQRGLTQIGSYGGGGVLGATGSGAREMGFEVILLAESERALDYLYQWLDATISSVCVTCATDTILIRRFCPDATPLNSTNCQDGVVELRGVGLTSGIQWGAPPVEQAGCYMRRVNFTLAATDPCMYGQCSTVSTPTQALSWSTCFAAADLDSGRDPCRPSCTEVPVSCRLAYDYTVSDPSAVAPVITFMTSGHPDGSYPFRIRTYANYLGLTPTNICGAAPLGELYIGSLPPYTEFVYDVARRRVELSNPSTGGFINAFAYIGPNDSGTPRFFGLGCGDYTTIIEPADWCVDTVPDYGREFLSVSLALRNRMGCA